VGGDSGAESRRRRLGERRGLAVAKRKPARVGDPWLQRWRANQRAGRVREARRRFFLPGNSKVKAVGAGPSGFGMVNRPR